MILLAAVATAPRAWAEPPAGKPPAAESWEQARQLSDEGMRHYRAGEYAQALAAFTRSYELSRNPALLFNLGQAARLAGRCDEALGYYRRYLDEAPNGPPYRDEAEQRISDARQCAAKREAPSPPPAARLDPPPAPPAAARPAATSAPLLTLETPTPSPAGERKWVKRSIVGGAIASAAFAVAGAGLAWSASAHGGALTDRYADGGSWDAAAAAEQSSGESAARWSKVSFGLSALLALAAAGLWWWSSAATRDR